MSPVYTMGVDIGSTASKCLILRDGREIASAALLPLGAGTSAPEKVIAQALEALGAAREQMAGILATGYGRNLVEAGTVLSELSCHARGAHHLFPEARTVIDIGGQDIKVLRVGRDGRMESFVMNEKCAAGTGRFLEVMARVLEVELNEMAALSAGSTEQVEISSTCTVFAESEVISQLSRNRNRGDIIAGIHRSVAGRVSGLARRVGVEPLVVMTGGVAQNDGVRLALEEELDTEVRVSPLAQYAGALGAALLAFKKL